MNEQMLTPEKLDIDQFADWIEDFWHPEHIEETQPSVNIKNNSNQYNFEIAIPGFDKEDISIEVNHHFMTIKSEKENKTETKNESFTRREFNYTSFIRSFKLPKDADESQIKAKHKNGVLFIEIGKKTLPEAKNKQIRID